MADADILAELNRLYWNSDDSVGDIADRLDLSRRALYEHLEPQPTGASCPECGASLVFRNRTARDNGEAECPECEQTVELEEVPEPHEASTEDELYEPAGRLSSMTWSDRTSGALLAIALLGGLSLGAMLYYLRRND